MLPPGGYLYVAEPEIHCSREAIERAVELAIRAGLVVAQRPCLSRATRSQSSRGLTLRSLSRPLLAEERGLLDDGLVASSQHEISENVAFKDPAHRLPYK